MATREFNDLKHEFEGRVGHVEDFSREFLIKLVRVYEDTTFYGFNAWATAYAKRVGEAEAWDTASEISRGIGRQIMPISLRIASKGPTWGDAGLVARPFDCTVEFLTKEGLIQLCQTYQDRWLKHGNHWLDAVSRKIGMEEAGAVFKEAYALVGQYEIPKVAKAGNLEPKTVVDAIKVANMVIDASTGFGGSFEVNKPRSRDTQDDQVSHHRRVREARGIRLWREFRRTENVRIQLQV